MVDSAFLQALTQGVDEKNYLQEDPYFTAGYSIASNKLPAPTTNAEALLGPLVQGLIGGALLGYGRRHAANAEYGDVRASPLISALQSEGYTNNIGPMSDGDLYGKELLLAGTNPIAATLSDRYASETAPSGWNAKTAKSDLLLAALLKKEEEDKARTRAAAASKLQEMLFKYSPEVTSMMANQAAEIETAKKTAALNAVKPGVLSSFDPEVDKLESSLRTEIAARAESKAYSDAHSILTTMEKAKDKNTRAADLAFVCGLPKLLDPSVVKESEQRMLINTQPGLSLFGSEIEAVFNNKGKLSKEAREAILDVARAKMSSVGGQYNEALKPYQARISRLKLRGEEVLPFAPYSEPPRATGRYTRDGKPTFIVNGIEVVEE